MKAATYARFSTDKQRDASIEDQLRNCRTYAERHGLELIQHFEDKAISGTSKDRAGLKAMLAAAQAGDFQVLLVDDLSRLSRDDVETKQIIRRFKFRRQRIVGVSDGYDSSVKGEKIQATVRGLMNDVFLDDLREKTHRGLYGQALAGNHTGGRTYGYRHVPIEDPARLDPHGRPVIVAVRREVDEAQAAIVREIFQAYADGKSPRAIAADLNARRVPAPGANYTRVNKRRDALWMASAIHGDVKRGVGILNNAVYIGKVIWNRLVWEKDPETGRRCWRMRPESEWVTREEPALRVVSDELWNRVKERQGELRARVGERVRAALGKDGSGGRYPKYILSGMLKCKACGGSFTLINGDRYGCATRVNGGRSACSNRLTVRRPLVESKILENLKSTLLSDDAIQEVSLRVRQLLRDRQREKAPEVDAARLKKLHEEVRNLTEAIATGALRSSPALAQRLATSEAELERLEAARAPAPELDERRVVQMLPQLKTICRRAAENIEDLLSRHTGRARAEVQRFIGDRVLLYPAPSGEYLLADVADATKTMAASMSGHSRFSWLRGQDLNL